MKRQQQQQQQSKAATRKTIKNRTEHTTNCCARVNKGIKIIHTFFWLRLFSFVSFVFFLPYKRRKQKQQTKQECRL